MKRKSALAVTLTLLLMPVPLLAHHGGISLAFGPGSPIETNSPLTLPRGGFVISTRAEQVEWRKFAFAEPASKDSFSFYNVGLSYGLKSYLTASLFVPYNIKRQDSYGSASGIGDLRFLFSLGMNHSGREGFKLNSADDTAVTLEGAKKTYFSLFGGLTFPTGRSDIMLGDELDPGMQPGFGSSSFTLGAAAARNISGPLSIVADTSYDFFTTRDAFKFGNELRANLAAVCELYGKPESAVSKIDGVLELNVLNVSRDEEISEGLPATGGKILYLSPGLRFSFPRLWNANLGVMLKLPVAKSLNEEFEQQGAEGLERYRLVATLSFYF